MLSVRRILALEIFQDGLAEVSAGAAGLDNPVRWVHISELAEAAQHLKGHELLLSTGLGLKGDASALVRLIRELAEIEAAGVIIELGRAFSEIPKVALEEAERRGLPLVVLKKEIRFVEVTEKVHAEIINRQLEELKKIENMSHEFTDLLLGDTGFRRIVEHLSHLLNAPVVLEDVAHQVVDFAGFDQDRTGEIICRWDYHSRVVHEPAIGVSESSLLKASSCVCVDVALRGEAWGRLHVLDGGRELDAVDRAAMQWAVVAIGVALLSQRSVTAQTDHARRSFLGDVLQRRPQTPTQFFHRARNLGAELEHRHLVALVLGVANLDELVRTRRYDEDDRQTVREALLMALRSAAEDRGISVLPGVEGDKALAIVGVPRTRAAVEAAAELALAAVELVEKTVDSVEGFAGVSDEATVTSLRRGFDQANEAFTYGVRAGYPRVHRHADLGVHHLLLKMSASPDLANFVESELRRLMEHDAHSNHALLPTLREYVYSSQNKALTARALHIDRRTLYLRLRKVESILGRSLDGHETLLRLAVALEGLEVLHSRVSGGRVQSTDLPAAQCDAFLQ